VRIGWEGRGDVDAWSRATRKADRRRGEYGQRRTDGEREERGRIVGERERVANNNNNNNNKIVRS
jgi:hypothetical protein